MNADRKNGKKLNSESSTDEAADGLTALAASAEDQTVDLALRPRSFRDFVGQERTLQILQMSIDSARKRVDVLDHVLFSGTTGLGNT